MPESSLAEEKIEQDLRAAFEARIRSDTEFACRVWCALTNVEWFHPDVGDPGLTFRDAGDLISRIRGSGTYIEWYCCGQAGVVTGEIAVALFARGWSLDGDVGEPRLDQLPR